MNALETFEDFVDEQEQGGGGINDDSEWVTSDEEIFTGGEDSHYESDFIEDDDNDNNYEYHEVPERYFDITVIDTPIATPFLTDSTWPENITAAIESCYSELSIQRCIIICDDEKKCASLADSLRALNHSVGLVSNYMMEDDRPLHMHVVHDFDIGFSRMLIMSLSSWNKMEMELEQVLPKHNMLVTIGLNNEEENMVITRIEDAWFDAIYPSMRYPEWWYKWKVLEPIDVNRPFYVLPLREEVETD